MEHIESCAQREKTDCTANKSLHGESLIEHFWSGWPGAYCLKCSAEDKDEICIAGGCECPCHDEFWRNYDIACSSDW